MINEISLICQAICEIRGIVKLTNESIAEELAKRGLVDWNINEYDVEEDVVSVFIRRVFKVNVNYKDYEPELYFDESGIKHICFPDVDEDIIFNDHCQLPNNVIFDWAETEDGSVITWESLFGGLFGDEI